MSNESIINELEAIAASSLALHQQATSLKDKLSRVDGKAPVRGRKNPDPVMQASLIAGRRKTINKKS